MPVKEEKAGKTREHAGIRRAPAATFCKILVWDVHRGAESPRRSPRSSRVHTLKWDWEAAGPSQPSPGACGAENRPGKERKPLLQKHPRDSRTKKPMASIYLVDRCLLLFMLVLLVQSACSLFLQSEGAGESGSIDIIVRTSLAAIFGYFLSGNFNRRTAAPGTGQTSLPQQEVASWTGEGPVAQIGFQASDGGEETLQRAETPSVSPPSEGDTGDSLQILTAAGIGLFSLIVLLLLRWKGMPEDPAATATAAQFRDFVSGCVGFLIGSPTRKDDSV